MVADMGSVGQGGLTQGVGASATPGPGTHIIILVIIIVFLIMIMIIIFNIVIIIILSSVTSLPHVHRRDLEHILLFWLSLLFEDNLEPKHLSTLTIM